MQLKRLFAVCASTLALLSYATAQERTSVFNFLNLPTSSHITALGGKNVSLVEDDISLIFHNPALLCNVSERTAGLGFSAYMKGSKSGTVAYSQHVGERGTWGAGVQVVGYGSMQETNMQGEVMGAMSALDMAACGTYSYLLSERWSGGVSGKIIYSKYGSYASCALAVDLGVNYYREETDFSLSATVRNAGAQIKAFGDHHERLPFDLEVGFTKGLGHAPIKLSLTLADLTRWSSSDYYTPGKKTSAGRIFTNHFCLGIDVVPSKLFYVSAGYNFRRAYEMKAAGSSHAAGLSAGAGLRLSRFHLGLAYAQYHLGAPTLAFSLSYSFKKG